MALPDLNLTPPEGGNIPEEENDEGIIIHEGQNAGVLSEERKNTCCPIQLVFHHS
jgi:hypothetical protein